MIFVNQAEAITTDNTERNSNGGRFSPIDRYVFSLTLAGLASKDGVDINAVIEEAKASAPAAMSPQDLASFQLDLQQAQYYAEAHAMGEAQINALIAQGVTAEEAFRQVHASNQLYAMVESASLGVDTANDVLGEENRSVLATTRLLTNDLAAAYQSGVGVSEANSLLDVSIASTRAVTEQSVTNLVPLFLQHSTSFVAEEQGVVSQREVGRTTLTISPYFSPNKAIAPNFFASSIGSSLMMTSSGFFNI
jgi:hypothetical protein